MKIIFSAVVLMMLIVAGWFIAGGPAPLTLEPVIDSATPVLMGVIPFLQPDKLREQMQPVCLYLEKKLARPVHFVAVSDYESLARLLELKKIHMAWFSHASFEKLKAENNWRVICRPVQFGSVLYDGQIVVRQKSEFNTIHDLRGHIFAYVDRYSGSGFYFPNMFMTQNGIKPLEFFSRVVFTQSHRSSILGVLDGTYDAAAVFSSNLVSESAEKLRVIARTGPIPNDPVVIREDLETVLKTKIESAMLLMHEDPDGIKYLKILKELRGTEKFVSEQEVRSVFKPLANASDSQTINY